MKTGLKKKTAVVAFRLTESEHCKLNLLCNLNTTTKSELLRKRVKGLLKSITTKV
jgi:hypothetical protein